MELIKNIFFNTDKLTPFIKVKISYTGKFFSDGSEKVFLHCGFGENWENLSNLEMTKTELGFQVEIDLINSELNKREPLTKLITRVLFKGKSDKFDEADVVYYGTINEGHWATKDEIIKYMLNNKFAINSIHFGPLTYQIWNRCLNFNPNTENRRNVMQVKWGSLERDLLIIEKERVENE